LNILLSAFACLPNYGTESGNGWNWASHLAETGHTVYVLTRAVNQERIERFLSLSPIANLHFVYVEVPLAKMYKHRDRGIYYVMWQMAALRAARKLLRTVRIDIVHHATYGSIHFPSQLWRLGLPIVFGPVGGGQVAPAAMLSYFGSGKSKEQQRSLITKFLPYSPLHRYWLRRMTCVLTSNRDTLDLAKRCGCRQVQFRLDVGLPTTYFAAPVQEHKKQHTELKLVWVGRVLPRKALPLALDALALVTQDVHLTIVGEAESPSLVQRMISDRGLKGRVTHLGRLPWNDTRDQYLRHDALLFTSLRDSVGSQLLEAMALGLPVICLDLHGARDIVEDGAGYRVPVTTPDATARALAATIDQYAVLSSEDRARMSRRSWEKARPLEWLAIVDDMNKVYARVLQTYASNAHKPIPTTTRKVS